MPFLSDGVYAALHMSSFQAYHLSIFDQTQIDFFV
jgi:hypothetical protein